MRHDQFLHPTECFGAGGGNRTRTLLAQPRILSPVRLPVPPPRPEENLSAFFTCVYRPCERAAIVPAGCGHLWEGGRLGRETVRGRFSSRRSCSRRSVPADRPLPQTAKRPQHRGEDRAESLSEVRIRLVCFRQRDAWARSRRPESEELSLQSAFFSFLSCCMRLTESLLRRCSRTPSASPSW